MLNVSICAAVFFSSSSPCSSSALEMEQVGGGLGGFEGVRVLVLSERHSNSVLLLI